MDYLNIVDELRKDKESFLDLGSLKIYSIVCSSDKHTTFAVSDDQMDQHMHLRVSSGNADNYEIRTQKTKLISKVRSENLPKVYKVVNKEQYSLILLESINGISLNHKLTKEKIEEKLALKLMMPIAKTLVKVWQKGLIYKYLSPSIIKLNSCDELVMDLPQFGGIYADNLPFDLYVEDSYKSPELSNGEKIDFRSDAWAFGAILFRAFAGRNFEPADFSCLQNSVSSCTISRETKDMLCALLSEKPSERINKPKDLLNMMQNCLLPLEIFDATKLKDESTNISDLNFQTQKMDPQKSFRELPQIGQEIGNCVLKELIGQGGFGYVYKAFHQILKIDLAIKILDPRTRNNDPTSVAMFLREARIAASISHPNIINTFEAGKDKGYHYIIMEYMNGGNLKDHMEKVGLSYSCLGKILLELSKGLSATEKLNIVHRDIKPANIMFSSNDSGCSIKIADMGLAKRLDLANEDNQITQNLSSQPINGSPAYMAPEMVLTPELVDSRADIYSLGATAYHAIAGEPMFKAKSARDTIMSHVQDQPKPLSEFKRDIPQQLEDIIIKMLEKKPADRHQSSKELAAEIESFIKNSQKNWSIKKLFNMALVKLI